MKNIVFDLGGVVFARDPRKCTKEFVDFFSFVTLPEMPARAGYTFAGWYSDIDLTMPWLETTPVTADMTLYAAWTGAETASAQGTWLPAAAILLLAAALAWYNRRKHE